MTSGYQYRDSSGAYRTRAIGETWISANGYQKTLTQTVGGLDFIKTGGKVYPSTQPVVVAQPSVSVATGVDPVEVANALYGKIIPLSALGKARIGTAGLHFGPYFNSGRASFGVSFGYAANPSGERKIYEVAMDGKVVWQLAAGQTAGALSSTGMLAENFTARFYSGTLSQSADSLETTHFGAEAIAYRPQMLLYFEDLPLAVFGGKIPFVSCVIGDTTDGADPDDGINLGEALERVALSPFVEFTSDTFEITGVTDIVGGMILTEDQTFLNMLRVITRFYRSIDIVQTDKLRLKDRGASITPDVVLSRDHVAGSGITYSKQEEASISRIFEVLAIDPDADYVFMPSFGVIPNVPAVLTSATAKESISLPLILTATQRQSIVTFAKYQEDAARKRVTFEALLRAYNVEPGDYIGLQNMADGFETIEVVKVLETTHGANFMVEITAEVILKCSIEGEEEPDPFFSNVILLAGFEDDKSDGWDDDSILDKTLVVSAGSTQSFVTSVGGNSSALNSGTASLIHWAKNGEDFGTDLFTIEGFFRPTSLPGTRYLVAHDLGVATKFGWKLYYVTDVNGTGRLRWTVSTDGTNQHHDLEGGDLQINVWQHVCVDFDGTAYRLYLNGVMTDKFVGVRNIFDPSSVDPSIAANSIGSGFNFVGYIDEVRITRGVARYGSDSGFIIPTVPFPRDGT